VQLRLFRRNATANATGSNQYLACPSDFLAPMSLSYTVDGDKFFVDFKDVTFVQTYNADPTVTGTPRYYAQFDVDNFILAPVPASGYTAELHYYYRPASIVDTGTSWLGTNAEQAMLYGCLSEAYTYMKGQDDLQQKYENRFIESVSRLKNVGEGRENIDAYRDGLTRVKAN
jgi:hypothetical protein